MSPNLEDLPEPRELPARMPDPPRSRDGLSRGKNVLGGGQFAGSTASTGSRTGEGVVAMTRLFLVTEDSERVWVAALIDEDVWTYVANTGRFHRNDGLRHDFFMLNELEYAEIGVSEARRLIAAGVGTLTEGWQADALDRWKRDVEAMTVETVFASHVADLA
jgi:hypothetical protein